MSRLATHKAHNYLTIALDTGVGRELARRVCQQFNHDGEYGLFDQAEREKILAYMESRGLYKRKEEKR